jgi:predicted metal-binding membrane protein
MVHSTLARFNASSLRWTRARPYAASRRRHGLRLGLRCSQCCAGLIAILLVIWVMNLRAMAVVTAAITGERLAPTGERVARATGAVAVGVGLFLIAQAAGLG